MLLCAEIFIEEFIKKQNLSHEVGENQDGSSVRIKAPWNGTDTVIYFNGPEGRDVSFVTCIEKVPDEKLESLYAVCNSLNAKYKWLRFYVDTDNYVIADDDAFLSENSVAEECERLLIPRFNIIEEVKPIIMRAIWA